MEKFDGHVPDSIDVLLTLPASGENGQSGGDGGLSEAGDLRRYTCSSDLKPDRLYPDEEP